MSDNPQFKRTDKAIIQALISLLRRKPFEKITVQDILTETPVTRATFYAHYRDKYEIAEKMLAHFLAARGTAREEFAASSHLPMKFIHNNPWSDREYAQALLKIHTENVDLRNALAGELEKEYLASTDSPTREIEARIYAQAYVELYLSLINAESPELTPDNAYQLLIPVALNILNLGDDHEAMVFLTHKVTQIL